MVTWSFEESFTRCQGLSRQQDVCIFVWISAQIDGGHQYTVTGILRLHSFCDSRSHQSICRGSVSLPTPRGILECFRIGVV